MLYTSLLLAASMIVGQADSESVSAPGLEVLREYGEIMVGRWKGDIIFGGDPPAEDQEIDPSSGYAVMKWILNETALEGNSRIGDTKFKWLYAWDPVRTTGPALWILCPRAFRQSRSTCEDTAIATSRTT